MKDSKKQIVSCDTVKNVFTVDTEDWFHANYSTDLFTNDTSVVSTVEENTENLLNHFHETDSTATFFILGFVARQHPELLRKISDAGHEIASHGYGHELVYHQTPQAFREDVHKSKVLIEDIVGKAVTGYRAPSWSITKQSLWALDILTQEGFLYDSSIMPFENFLYGISDAPRFRYSSRKYSPESDLLEIPPSTIRFIGISLPFSGGFYFRALPGWLIDRCTRHLNRNGQETVFYLHPREIDPLQPRLPLSRRNAFIHYYGIRGCEKKLIKILNQYTFCSIHEAFYLQ